MNSSTSLLQVFSKQVRKYHLEEISIDINLGHIVYTVVSNKFYFLQSFHLLNSFAIA